jgi:hypothetical protein
MASRSLSVMSGFPVLLGLEDLVWLGPLSGAPAASDTQDGDLESPERFVEGNTIDWPLVFNAHGKDDLQQLLAADLLWSDPTDLFAALGSGFGVLWIHSKRKNWLAHDAFFYALFAVVASVLVQSLGVFLVFALLIAPAILRLN